ncbi:MAG: alpha/beta fold hydrolase [Litorimonas sp.]
MRRIAMLSVLALAACRTNIGNSELPQVNDLKIASLDGVTIPTLRSREYASDIVVETFDTANCVGTNPVTSLPGVDGAYRSYMASFRSDGLRQYARLTIPDTPAPKGGYPFILFLHGYVGEDKAPNYSIGCDPDNLYYSELTDAFARAGFAVLSPGYRGHGAVEGVPADGLNYLDALDQGAGISTQFYAIDALNFVAGLLAVDGSEFPDQSFDFDMSRYFLLGHSQGGDAGLTVLAAIGEGAQDHLRPVQSALWSGTFLPRLRALEEMMPVALSAEAFLSGDGTWTGTAIAKDGSSNPNFIFGFPPDWIETPNPAEWSWQKETWSERTVASSAESEARKMYQELKDHVADLADIKLDVRNEDGGFEIMHDAKIEHMFANIGAYNFAQYLTESVELHVPNKDHYSQVSWNQDLCARINDAGGDCNLVIYPDNNHSLRASPYEWFSSKGTPDGYPIMVDALVTKFNNIEPER